MLRVGPYPDREAALGHRVLAALVQDANGGKLEDFAGLVLHCGEVSFGFDHTERRSEREVAAALDLSESARKQTRLKLT